MKGKDKFSSEDFEKLKTLTKLRIITPASGQKVIRQKMRDLGFFGRDDWGLKNLQVTDLDALVQSGKIKVIDGNFKPSISSTILKIDTTSNPATITKSNRYQDINSILVDLKKYRFDPLNDDEIKVNDCAGNYIICLNKNIKLPETLVIPVFKNFDGLEVIYTGIASVSLRTRDYRQHFNGNAGRSTLRKSLGALFGYKQIPRDINQKNNKTKFEEYNEQKISKWMRSNLIMFALPTNNCEEVERLLINYFNPPLNLKDNHNIINLEFRRLLSSLRNQVS